MLTLRMWAGALRLSSKTVVTLLVPPQLSRALTTTDLSVTSVRSLLRLEASLPQQATTALGSTVGFTGGKFNVEAILSIGAIELTTMDGASPAATLADPYTLAEGAPNTFGDGPNGGVVAGIDAGNVFSRAMELSFEESQTNALMAAAGSPAAVSERLTCPVSVSTSLLASLAPVQTSAAGDLNTLNDGNITLGQLNDGLLVLRPTTLGTTSTMNWPTTPPSSASCRSAALPECEKSQRQSNKEPPLVGVTSRRRE